MTGSGTLEDPYIIYDVDDLQAMENELTAYYELANDIDASATVGWNDVFRQVDELEFDTDKGIACHPIHVSGTVYAIAYQGTDNDGFLKTVTITNDGDIGSVIDTLEFDTGFDAPGGIIHISGDIYAIAYMGVDGHGWLVTVEIDSAGNITDTVVDSYEFDDVGGVVSHIIHIAGTIYAMTYAKEIAPYWRLWLKTISIADNGTIGSEVDSLEFDTGSFNALTSYMTHVSGDIYAIAHCTHTGGGWYKLRITTVDIDSAGNIEDAVVDTLDVGDASFYTIRTGGIVHVAGVIYAVVVRTYGPDYVYLYTLDIDNAGGIGAVIDTYEVSTSAYQWSRPHILKLSTEHYAVAWTDTIQYGRLKVIKIEGSGAIGPVIESLLFQVDKALDPYMIGITSAVIGIAYQGPGSDGWLKTFGYVPTGFLPIGQAADFTGQLDGKGYKVIDLYINRPSGVSSSVGLFYAIETPGVVKNLTLENCDITGMSAGSIVNNNYGGTIENCHASGSVVASSAGGFVRWNYGGGVISGSSSSCMVTGEAGFCYYNEGSISECSATGNVIGVHYGAGFCYSNGGIIAKSYASGQVSGRSAGGFTGFSGTESQCYATGDVEGVDEAGGYTVWGGTSIINCYARGNVTGTNPSYGYVGGFIAYNFAGQIVDKCYSTGLVTGLVTVGGFCGVNGGTITNCFWDTETSGTETSDGGTGKITAEMKTKSTFTDAGWNFSTIWGILSDCNNGYPCLRGVTPSCLLKNIAGLNPALMELLIGV